MLETKTLVSPQEQWGVCRFTRPGRVQFLTLSHKMSENKLALVSPKKREVARFRRSGRVQFLTLSHKCHKQIGVSFPKKHLAGMPAGLPQLTRRVKTNLVLCPAEPETKGTVAVRAAGPMDIYI